MKNKPTAIEKEGIKVGEQVIVDRGSLGLWKGKLLSIYKQGWWQYGEIEMADGTIHAWDTDVHKISKL